MKERKDNELNRITTRRRRRRNNAKEKERDIENKHPGLHLMNEYIKSGMEMTTR